MALRFGPIVLILAVLATGLAGCGMRTGAREGGTIIRVEGSDTMVNIAQAWAERYHQKHPEVSVQVLGGGSGIGIASLIDGNCDLANSSRKMTAKELAEAQAHRGAEPVEHIVGYDALGIYVHRDNPRQSISIDELAEIYGESGSLTRWSQLGVAGGIDGHDKIIRVGRQNSSGTYEFFRSTILGKKRDFKLGSLDANGSKDVVALVSRTPPAIGYSGMGYRTNDVKMLEVSRRRGDAPVAATLDNARRGTYPVTRPLQIYTAGELPPSVRQYLEWIVSPEGQEVVRELGYVPLTESASDE